MNMKEYVAKANEVAVEIQSVVGDDFRVGEFSRHPNQPRVLSHNVTFRPLLTLSFATLDQIRKEYNYRRFIKDRTIENFKRQIIILQEAVKKLEATNVKSS